MHTRPWFSVILVVVCCVFGMAAPAAARPATPATLIVVSLDGFRADYFDRGLTPTIASLAADGVRAKAMRPAFPSMTSPNHYTLMTGLTPDHHGIIDNYMRDVHIPGEFGTGSATDRDPRWWDKATPLWVTAARAGVRTASMAWPGDNVIIHGVQPSLSPGPGNTKTADQRVDGVLAWLDRPPSERPKFVMLYFGGVDHAGHAYGPDSPQVNTALAEVDGALARLIAGLRARRLDDMTNLIVLADHGMIGVSKDRSLVLDDMIDLSKVIATSAGAAVGIDPKPGHEAEITAILLAPHSHLTCWRKAEIPARLRYGSNPRVPPIFCLAEPGWSVGTRAMFDMGERIFPGGVKGSHGYPGDVPEMAALFVAHGPAFRRGVVIPDFDNVNVYPLLATLLGVKAEQNDGDLAVLASALIAPRR